MSRSAKALPPSRPWVLRLAVGHVRLWVALAVAVIAYLGLSALEPTARWSVVTRLLIAWDLGLLVYLVGAATMMARSSHTDIKTHCDIQDEGAFGIMVLTITAAAASFGAIFAELAAAKGAPQGGWSYALAIITVVLSWTFTHTIFALHYAYEFYGEGKSANGLDFPGEKNPDYWDFVYFAFVLGMTFQVSDVQVTNKSIRHSVTIHGVLAFFFATTIVALTVSMAASAIS
jgi:uncharacterized membrane protein